MGGADIVSGLLDRRQVPHLDRLVPAPSGQSVLLRQRVCERLTRSGVTGDSTQRSLSTPQVPYEEVAVVGDGGEVLLMEGVE